jgi:zinc protease
MNSFKLEDLKKYWKTFMQGENIVVGVSSSTGYKETAALVRKYLSGVKKGRRMKYRADFEKLKNSVKGKSTNIYLIKKDIPQSTVIFGTIAPDIHYSGNYSLALLNYILGGGSFNSRLLREIRVKKGYAYVAHSTIRNRGGSGIFLAYTQTKNINVDKVIPIMTDNIKKMVTTPVEKSELEWAKNAYFNSYIFRFDTPADIISNYLSLAYYDLPEDYYGRYLSNIGKVWAGDIQNEGMKLFGNGLVKLVVGPEALKNTLARFGNVVVIDVNE